MQIQILYGVEHVVDVVTADEVTDQEVQDFLHDRHVIQVSTVAMQHPPANLPNPRNGAQRDRAAR